MTKAEYIQAILNMVDPRRTPGLLAEQVNEIIAAEATAETIAVLALMVQGHLDAITIRREMSVDDLLEKVREGLEKTIDVVEQESGQ